MSKQRTLHDVGSLEDFIKALTAANTLWPGAEVTIDPADPLVMVVVHELQEVGKLDFSEGDLLIMIISARKQLWRPRHEKLAETSP